MKAAKIQECNDVPVKHGTTTYVRTYVHVRLAAPLKPSYNGWDMILAKNLQRVLLNRKFSFILLMRLPHAKHLLSTYFQYNN